MADINRMLLLGRLGTDPVLRSTKNGTPVATFSMATEVFLKTKNEVETTWHRVVAWGRPAERCSEELKKGMPVFIEGRMRVRKWEKTPGDVSYFHEIHVENVKFIHRRASLQAADTVPAQIGALEELEEVTH